MLTLIRACLVVGLALAGAGYVAGQVPGGNHLPIGDEISIPKRYKSCNSFYFCAGTRGDCTFTFGFARVCVKVAYIDLCLEVDEHICLGETFDGEICTSRVADCG